MKDQTVELLKEHGINPTSQRVRIYDYLAHGDGHPTVDDIYAVLQKDGHLFSRATVYNTVNLFLEKGLIHNVKVEPHEMRYDVTSAFHAHFKCTSCGAIFDIEMEEPMMREAAGFHVDHTSLVFSGVCPACQGKHEEE